VSTLLEIYLNDHLAGATAGRELARRAAAGNRNSAYGPFLERLAVQIQQDRQSLIDLMGVLEVDVDHLKVIGGWTAEAQLAELAEHRSRAIPEALLHR
jgi:hypothetical protein